MDEKSFGAEIIIEAFEFPQTSAKLVENLFFLSMSLVLLHVTTKGVVPRPPPIYSEYCGRKVMDFGGA